MDPAIPTNEQALLAAVLIGVATPLVVALLTKPGAPAWLTGLLSGLTSFSGAAVAYLMDVQGIVNWTFVLGLFVESVVIAQGFRKGVDPGIEKAVSDSTARFGLSTRQES